nr:putative ribonuclease H-like domain-containing protein [Tanacetum cinerariifolium]
MVAYLKKPTRSEGFQEIVDFLNGSHIRTVDNGEQELNTTVDGKEFTVTEASVRRHLQLADANAIQAEEGEGLGHPYKPQPPPSSAQPTNEEPIPNVASSSHQKTQTPRQAFKQAKVLVDAARKNVQTYTRRIRVVSTASGGISTASRLFSTIEELVSTDGASMPVGTAGMQEQDKLRYEAAVRLQEELDEEERQRMARVHEVAQSFIKEEWENIRARLRKLSFDEIKKLFETTMKIVNTFVPIKTEVRGRASELAAGSSQATIIDSTKIRNEEENELSQEDLQQMMMVVPVEEVYDESLLVKYPIIDYEVYIEESRKYWKIIRVGLDTHSFDDLYNNLRVFEHDVKGTTASSTTTQNMVFMSGESTSSTNNVSTTYSVSSLVPQLDYDDLEQINDDDMEEMDLKWRDAGYNGNKARDNSRHPAYQEDSNALVTIDGEDINCSGHVEEDAKNYVMMAYSNLSSDNETDAPIIEEYESDSDDDSMSKVQEEKQKPIFAFTNSVKHVNNSRENIKEKGAPNHSPKIEKQDSHSQTRKGLGYAFTRKACFVCGSFSHLIRDCDFHEKRMAKQAELTINKNKVIGQQENRPVWNNVQRVNKQNKFVPLAILTKTGKFPVNAARQNYSSKAASTSTARKVNTARSFVNETRPKRNFYKSHSPSRRPFHKPTAQKLFFSYQQVNIVRNKSLSAVGGYGVTAVKASAGNKDHLVDYQDFKGGSVAFEGSNERITEQGYFTDTDCLVLSPDFELLDENQVLLKILRQDNMYSFNLKNIAPSGDLACLLAKASIDESNKWYRRLGHVNFKDLNKLVKGKLVRGLPSKIFENYHTCVACQKGKQHKASCKAKTVSSVNQPLQILHMDIFRPTSVKSINHKTYCLVNTDGFSRFSWVYFLKSKDETTPILKDFIRKAKNKFNHKVKTIRSDNGTEFKNHELIKFYESKGIKRKHSNARTPQQNGVAERKNMTLIEAARPC